MDKKAYTINKYATGSKVYGMGRSNPTDGPVDKLGYRERDAEHATRRNALLRYMKAHRGKNYLSSDWLGRRNGR